jgi:hypothetical protein
MQVNDERNGLFEELDAAALAKVVGGGVKPGGCQALANMGRPLPAGCYEDDPQQPSKPRSPGDPAPARKKKRR